MKADLWELHASVFELARTLGLRGFRVKYREVESAVVIELVLAAAEEGRGSRLRAR